MKQCWEWRTLEDIATVYNGNSIKTKGKEENYTGVEFGIPYIATKDVSFDHQIDYDNGVLIPEPKSSELKVAPPNSVLVCAEGGSAGRKIAHNDRRINFGNKLYAVVPDATVDSQYLFYYCISNDFFDAFLRVMTGLIGGVSLKKFKTLLLPVPPIPEQKRIVAILDDAFAGISQAVANTEKNLANARELFESYLNNVFTLENIGWSSKPLSDLCDSNRAITYGVIKLGKENPNGIPCLRTSNVRWLHIEVEAVKKIDPSLSEEYKRTILLGGEVLVNVRGTLGGVAVVGQEMAGWNVSREVAVVPTNQDQINPKYLSYWIGAKASQDWLTEVHKGVAYTGINLADLRALPISYPDKKSQKYIVNKIDKMFAELKRLETIYQQKLIALAELKQSILQKAFAGELTVDAAPQQVTG